MNTQFIGYEYTITYDNYKMDKGVEDINKSNKIHSSYNKNVKLGNKIE